MRNDWPCVQCAARLPQLQDAHPRWPRHRGEERQAGLCPRVQAVRQADRLRRKEER